MDKGIPLLGRRIVITRARDSGAQFARELHLLGAEVIEFPTIEVVAPDSFEAIDTALARVADFDWIIFTSATGVEAFLERMEARGTDVRAMARARIGAIGPATAARLASHGLKVAATPEEYRAEALVDAIGVEHVRDARILIPRAQVAREVLPQMLLAAGATEVLVAPVYKTVKPAWARSEQVRKLADGGGIDIVTFTSSSTVSNFCEMVGEPSRGLNAAVIGPVTAQTAREAGFKVVVQPREYTVPALIAAIREFFEIGPR
jgi:uroporphyrinogen III methyltransferase / synthase